MQSVIERAQIRADLLRQIAGQEAELLAGLDRRPAQDDPFHPPFDQRRHRHRHRQVGLSRTRRPDAEDDVVLADGVDVRLLVEALGRHRPVAVGDVDGVEEDVFQVGGRVRQHHLAGLLHIFQSQRVLALDQLSQLREQLLGEHDPLRLTRDEEDIPALSDVDPEPLLDQLEVFAPPAGEGPCAVVVQQLQPRRWFAQTHLTARNRALPQI